MENSQLEGALLDYDRPIDLEKDIHIDLEKTATQYVRFNGRATDENLEIEDVIPVMIPAKLETTNCLQFKLVLLQSDIVPRDYVVGWGVFPLLNSDFGLNEGKFKIPLIFGNVDPRVDMFNKMELAIMKDLDQWVSNLYFEIEKVNLMDVKDDKKTKKLYYQPVSGMTAQEQQQKNKQEDNDEYEDEVEAERERDEMLKERPNDPAKEGVVDGFKRRSTAGPGQLAGQIVEATDEDEGPASTRSAAAPDKGEDTDSDDDDDIDTSEVTSMNDEEIAEAEAERYAELMYNAKRDQEQINYDHYQFSVAQKYDLTTRALTFKKVKYIADELFLDLQWRMRKTIQFKTSILFIVFVFFLRQFAHYLGMYFACRIMEVPIEKFELLWYRVELEEAAWSEWQEAAVIIAGPVCCLCLFLVMAISSGFFRKICGCYPKYFYKVIAWTGLFAVLDPYFVLIADCAS